MATHPCHVCGTLVEEFTDRSPLHPCCSRCFAPIRTPVEPTVERGDLLLLYMYGDPTVDAYGVVLGCEFPSALEMLARWAPEARALEAYAALLRAFAPAEFTLRSSTWPKPLMGLRQGRARSHHRAHDAGLELGTLALAHR